MSSVLDQITKKIELLGEGKTYEEHLFEPENLLGVIKLEDPRIYKQLFNLDNKGGLAIEKTLKNLLLEVKDSLCTFYYVLDSSCMSIDFTCTYQTLDTIKEVHISLISYLRILCSKKALIEININDSFIYIVFEDSIVKDNTPKTKLKKGEKREKEIGKKYVLELSLSRPYSLDLAVIELFKEILDSDKKEVIEDTPLPIKLNNILYNKEPLQLYRYEVETNKNKFSYIVTDGLSFNIVICPTEVAKYYEKENTEANEYIVPDDAYIDYDEDVQKLSEVIFGEKISE